MLTQGPSREEKLLEASPGCQGQEASAPLAPTSLGNRAFPGPTEPAGESPLQDNTPRGQQGGADRARSPAAVMAQNPLHLPLCALGSQSKHLTVSRTQAQGRMRPCLMTSVDGGSSGGVGVGPPPRGWVAGSQSESVGTAHCKVLCGHVCLPTSQWDG